MDRLKAAWAAFRDPSLVGEARGMRNSLDHLWKRGEFALLEAEIVQGHLFPIVKMVCYEQRQAIRRYLGWLP